MRGALSLYGSQVKGNRRGGRHAPGAVVGQVEGEGLGGGVVALPGLPLDQQQRVVFLEAQVGERAPVVPELSTVGAEEDLIVQGNAERLEHLLLECRQGAREASHSKAAAIMQLEIYVA